MAVTLGGLHLRKVYNQKPCPSQTLPSEKKMQVQKNPAWFPNTFSYKHLQKTTRTHPHCICMGAPRLMALQNATTERPRFFLDVSLPYNGFQTLDTLEQKPMGFKPEIDQRVRKKNTSISAHQFTNILFHALQLGKISTPRSGWNKSEMLHFFWDFLGDLFLPKLQEQSGIL